MTTAQDPNSVRASLVLDPAYDHERELLAMVNGVDEKVSGRRARGKLLRAFIRAGWMAQRAADAQTTEGEGGDDSAT